MTKRTIVLSVVVLFIIFSIGSGSAANATGLADNIAFLKKGDVWIADQHGRGAKPLTRTAGKVEDFLFSPTLRYLAYSKIIAYADEPGLWEKGEAVPQRALCSIVIMDMASRKVLREIMPPGDWIYPATWLPGEKLLFYEASGFDVAGFFEYDVQKGVQKEIEYGIGSQLWGMDFYGGGYLSVDDSGLGDGFRQNLHLVDLRSKDDKIVVSKRSVADPRMSHDKKNIAFIEMEPVEKGYFDNLWICRLTDGSLRKIYRGPARAKTARTSGLAWSPDGRYLGMFFSPNALVIEIDNPDTTYAIQGTDFHWLSDKKILFAQGNSLRLYSVETRKEEILIKDASRPEILRRAR